MPSISSTFILSRVSKSITLVFLGLAPSMSLISKGSLMNLGGVTALFSTWDKLYLGFKGSFPKRLVWNLTQLGEEPFISWLFRLYWGLFSPMCN